MMPGGLGGFVPCAIGANHCSLRHVGWERCGHGLTSQPRENASEAFLKELLQLSFGTLQGLLLGIALAFASTWARCWPGHC